MISILKCPCILASETEIVQYSNDFRSPDSPEDSCINGYQSITKTIYLLAECLQGECAAWRDGCCHYRADK